VNYEEIELFVPGRLCLFGEHSDWAGQMRKFNSNITPGQALVACTEEGIHATARICDSLKLRTVTADGQVIDFEHPFDTSGLRKIAAEGGYFSYIAGVAAYISTFYDIGGLELNCYKMTLPQKKGLSSSAAISVLTARAFSRLYGLNLTVRGEMEAAYYGEQLTPSRCGRLDQACAYGKGIVQMIFDGDSIDVYPVKTNTPLYLVFADLMAEKDTIAILQDLNAAYPYSRTDEHLALHELLGVQNELIIEDVLSAISANNHERIGALMREAQVKFDRYAAPLSPVELQAENLHKVLNDPVLAKWVYGGKGVGSQGDGSIQFVAKSCEDQIELKSYLSNTLGLDSYTLTIPKTQTIRKAVLPVAGYGTRMYPATKTIKKELLPVIDTDGYVKPSLLIILDELFTAGIEEICLIIRPGEEEQYLSLFTKLQDGHYQKLPEGLNKYECRLLAIRKRLTFVYQDEVLGFGHAVLQSERFSNNEPVLLMLGDHLYSSTGNLNCAAQMIAAYEKTEKLTIGVFEIQLEDVPKYGVVQGHFVPSDGSLVNLSSLIEKPTVEYAESRLGVDGKQYAIFMYIINSDVYASLKRELQEGKTEFGEFQLTPSLNSVAKNNGAYGVLINGKRFDIGSPSKYRQTVSEFGRNG